MWRLAKILEMVQNESKSTINLYNLSGTKDAKKYHKSTNTKTIYIKYMIFESCLKRINKHETDIPFLS